MIEVRESPLGENPDRTVNDYYGEDGVLYCGRCSSPKERIITLPFGPEALTTKVPCICKCQKQKMEEQRKADSRFELLHQVESLRLSSNMGERYKSANFSTFQRNADNEKAFRTAEKYVANFKDMKKSGQGILFYGPVGTGKSYLAAAIANELMDRLNSAVVTSCMKILQDIESREMDEGQYMSALLKPDLLVIDDLGAERSTDYASEKVYNAVDGRYRSGKPMIFTTNRMLGDMMKTVEAREKRIYDRILEMCYPVKMSGESWRRSEAARRFNEMKSLTEG